MEKRRIIAALVGVAMLIGLQAGAVGTDRGYHSAAGGVSHSLAVADDGSVYTWGANSSGQLGVEDEATAKKPIEVEGIKAISVAAGYDFSVALSYDGSVYVWGAGMDETPVDTNLTGIVAIDAGQTDILALGSDGMVWQWMYGGKPRQVPGLSRIVNISSGGGHNLALTLDGQVYAWGNNYRGQLGDGTTQDRAKPVKLPLINIIDIAAGVSHSLAASFDGKVYAWGSNDYGELGDGTTEESTTPVVVEKITGAIQVAAGNCNSLALNQKGDVYSWGYGEYGQVGTGDNDASHTKPASVSQLSGKATFVECGVNHCLAVTENGTLYTWGRNKDGQLGNNKDSNSNTPQKIRDHIAVGGGYQPDATEGASDWAAPEIKDLYASDLVPPMLWGDYTANITRAEFAGLLVGLYENVKGSTASASSAKKYVDLPDHPLETELRKALSLGLIDGSSDTTVSPDRILTRQEGAKMLCTFISKMERVNISQKLESLAFYQDARDISDWAAPYIFYAYKNDIMKGNSEGEFAPLDNLTREQSLITVNRLVEKYGWGK